MKKSILLLIVLIVACSGGGQEISPLYLKPPDYSQKGNPSIFGDSLAYGLASQYEGSANYGVGGSQTSWWLKNMPPTEMQFKVSIYWGGTNDLNAGVPINQILENCWKISLNLKSEDTYFLPVIMNSDRAKEFNAGLKELFKDRFIDLDDIPVTSADGIHPDAVMNERVIERIKEVVGE